MRQTRLYEKVKVVHVPFDESHEEMFPTFTIPNLAIIDLLTLIAGLSLQQQCMIILNVLTVSGFDQREISGAIGMNYQDYRTNIMQARRDLKNNLP